MKKTLLTILLFIAFIKVADSICYYFLNYVFTHTYTGQEGGDLNKYLHDKNPPEMVLMGASTTKLQVSPDSFPLSACNLSRASAKDSYQMGVLLLMIKNKQIPKVILLSVEPKNYLQAGTSDKQPEDVLFLKYYYDDVPFLKNEINNIAAVEKYKYLFASSRFNGYATHIFKNYYQSQKQDNSKYFFQYQQSTAADSINIINTTLLHPDKKSLVAAPLSKQSCSYLPRFIDTCKKYNIKLLCFEMQSYHYDSVKLANANAFIKNVLTQKNIPFLSITPANAPVLFKRLSYWSDAIHLNEIGGAIESHLLANFVKENL